MDLLECAEARKSIGVVTVQACPPLQRGLAQAEGSSRGSRQLDAEEAARRLATGWETGVSMITTGSVSRQR